MITIGNKKFGCGKSAMVSSVFEPGGTASGYYVRRAHGLLFHDMRGTPFAFLRAPDSTTSALFVNAFRRDDPADKRIFYQHSTSTATARMLGIAGMGYAEEMGAALKAWNDAQTDK